VADQHDRAVLVVQDPAARVGVALQRQGWVLHDADLVAVVGEQVVDGLPAGPIHEAAMDEQSFPVGAVGVSADVDDARSMPYRIDSVI
jgi:hypothetical protein